MEINTINQGHLIVTSFSHFLFNWVFISLSSFRWVAKITHSNRLRKKSHINREFIYKTEKPVRWISDTAAPRNTDNIPRMQPLSLSLSFLPSSVRFLFFNVGFSHRQALLPWAYRHLQDYLLAKHFRLKENNFKFKQKSQDRLYLVYLREYAHLLANHIDLGVVSGMSHMTTQGGQSFQFLLYSHLVWAWSRCGSAYDRWSWAGDTRQKQLLHASSWSLPVTGSSLKPLFLEAFLTTLTSDSHGTESSRKFRID